MSGLHENGFLQRGNRFLLALGSLSFCPGGAQGTRMSILRFRQPEKNFRVFHSQRDGLAKLDDCGGVLSQARKGPCQGEASGS